MLARKSVPESVYVLNQGFFVGAVQLSPQVLYVRADRVGRRFFLGYPDMV